MAFLSNLFGLGSKKTQRPLRLMIAGRETLDDLAFSAMKTKLLQHEANLILEDEAALRLAAEGADERALYRRFLEETRMAKVLVIGFTRDDPGTAKPGAAKLTSKTFETALPTLPAGGLIRSWLDEELAQVRETDGTVQVLVPDLVLAGISEIDRKRLGLGKEARITLRVERSGVVNKPDFNINEYWIRNERTLASPIVEGAILRAGSAQHLLPGVFAITHDAIERFRGEVGTLPDLAWAKLTEIFKATHLEQLTKTAGTMRLMTASDFSIGYDKELARIRPYFLRPNPLPGTERKNFAPLLTERYLQIAVKQMRMGDEVPGHIVFDSSTFLLIPKELRKVLRVVNDLAVQGGEAANRLMFNPMLAIRKELTKGNPDALTDPDVAAALDAAETLFVETPDFLSQRIKGFGPWSPKLLGFVNTFKAPWFPESEDRMTLLIGGECVSFTKSELKAFLGRLETAQAQGAATIDVNGADVDIALIDAGKIREILKAKSGDEEKRKSEGDLPPGEGKEDDGDESEEPKRFGPILKDNLETLAYLAERVRREPFTHPTPTLAGGFSLLPHQHEALDWLKGLWNRGVPGALLADDMGLGKTLQCLTFLEWLRRGFSSAETPRPALVVAPVGLLYNWEAEGRKYFPESLATPLILKAETVRRFAYRSSSEVLREISDAPWVLTSYETLRDKNELFRMVDWGLVVFDEIQKIKNPTALMTEMAKTLQSQFALALTGTPVENSFQDLWSIMDTVVPGFMGSLRDFNGTYSQNEDIEASGRELHRILTGQLTAPGLDAEDSDGKDEKDGKRAEGAEPIVLMMRRLKQDRLKSLPQKTLRTHRIEMPPAQRAAYMSILEARQRDPKAPENSPLAVLQRLNRCSFSPDIAEGLTEASIERSGRLKALFAILDEIAAKGEKAVIFVQHHDVQRELASLIAERMKLAKTPSIINGSTKPEVRQDLVKAFQNEPEGFDVIILTGRAAGTGLTLTAANHAVHLERWWNPAVEDQCSDRVYRIGQTKDVTVHIPMAVLSDGPGGQPSFDDTLEAFLANKRTRSTSVLMPIDDDPRGTAFAQEFFKNDADVRGAVGAASGKSGEAPVVDSTRIEDVPF